MREALHAKRQDEAVRSHCDPNGFVWGVSMDNDRQCGEEPASNKATDAALCF